MPDVKQAFQANAFQNNAFQVAVRYTASKPKIPMIDYFARAKKDDEEFIDICKMFMEVRSKYEL